MDQYIDKVKLAPDMSPLIVVGDKMDQVKRSEEFVDLNVLRNGKLNSDEKSSLKKSPTTYFSSPLLCWRARVSRDPSWHLLHTKTPTTTL